MSESRKSRILENGELPSQEYAASSSCLLVGWCPYCRHQEFSRVELHFLPTTGINNNRLKGYCSTREVLPLVELMGKLYDKTMVNKGLRPITRCGVFDVNTLHGKSFKSPMAKYILLTKVTGQL